MDDLVRSTSNQPGPLSFFPWPLQLSLRSMRVPLRCNGDFLFACDTTGYRMSGHPFPSPGVRDHASTANASQRPVTAKNRERVPPGRQLANISAIRNSNDR